MSGTLGTLGKYQIIREIARSNDIVYEAYDPVMNRRVALKELAMPGGSTDQQKEDRKSRFLREARAAGTLTHPNIVTVFEYGEDQGKQFIAMEYLEGHNLRNEIDTHGFLPPERALEVAFDVLDALDYAHNHGVIHRDIKPDNIQMLPDGRVKITDFGIARLTFEPNLTMDGQIFGTPSYMSPEQVVGKDIDARSDLFSVAVVLFEMISGKKPFAGDSVVSLTYAIMNSHPTQPTQMNWAIWQVVEQCLEKSPQLRFANASAMREALKSAQDSSRTGVMDGSNVASVFQQTYQPNVHSSVPPPVVGQAPGAGPYSPAPYGIPNPYQANPQHPGGQPVYTYNPYGATPTGQPYSPTGGPPPSLPDPSQYPQHSTLPPIYYPAPPKGPLFRPETVIFMRKALLTFIVLGTFFGLLIAVIQSASAWVANNQKRELDRPLVARLGGIDSEAPLGEQIRQVIEIKGKLVTPENRKLADQKLAQLYLENAKTQLASGNFAAAEASVSDVVLLDPTNPSFLAEAAVLYETLALRHGQGAQRLGYLAEASKNLKQAVQYELDPQKKDALTTKLVHSYAALGNEYLAQGYLSEARQVAYEGLDLARNTSHPARKNLEAILSRANG